MAKENGGVIGIINTPTSTTASGVWALQDQYEAKRNGNWPLTPFVSPYSARFNSGSSDYLNRTPASSGNRKTWTYSTWIKLSNLSTQRSILSAGNTTYYTDLRIDSNNQITFFIDDSLSYSVTTSPVLRDVSAWYHVVVAFDTTQATASNRVKFYLNGSQQTTFVTTNYPAQNYDGRINSTDEHSIGRRNASNNHFLDGYLAETYMIDGQALTPSSFGASNASGVWYPIPYTGSYGTNGFYLKFGNASSLGTDSSPNGNNWTVNNLTSVDQSTDSTLNNFCTWNSVNIFNGTSTSRALTEGNLAWTSGGTGSDGAGCMSTFAVSSGKWYAEIKVTVYNQFTNIGVAPPEIVRSSHGSSSTDYIGYESDGTKYIGSTSSAYGSSYANGDIIGIALNMDSSQVTFYKNGTSQGAISITSGKDYAILVTTYNGATNQANFGSPMYSANGYTDAAGYGNFSYAVPSGYYALCTANLNTYG